MDSEFRGNNSVPYIRLFLLKESDLIPYKICRLQMGEDLKVPVTILIARFWIGSNGSIDLGEADECAFRSLSTIRFTNIRYRILSVAATCMRQIS